MFNLTKTSVAAGIIALAALGGATPAMAGQCPAGQETANPLADRATAPKDVTDDVLGSIDLGQEIGVAGRDLRLRRLVVQTGGALFANPTRIGTPRSAAARRKRRPPGSRSQS